MVARRSTAVRGRREGDDPSRPSLGGGTVLFWSFLQHLFFRGYESVPQSCRAVMSGKGHRHRESVVRPLKSR